MAQLLIQCCTSAAAAFARSPLAEVEETELKAVRGLGRIRERLPLTAAPAPEARPLKATREDLCRGTLSCTQAVAVAAEVDASALSVPRTDEETPRRVPGLEVAGRLLLKFPESLSAAEEASSSAVSSAAVDTARRGSSKELACVLERLCSGARLAGQGEEASQEEEAPAPVFEAQRRGLAESAAEGSRQKEAALAAALRASKRGLTKAEAETSSSKAAESAAGRGGKGAARARPRGGDGFLRGGRGTHAQERRDFDKDGPQRGLAAKRRSVRAMRSLHSARTFTSKSSAPPRPAFQTRPEEEYSNKFVSSKTAGPSQHRAPVDPA